MTRKDYIVIAEALRIPHNSLSRPTYERELSGVSIATLAIADALEQDNPRFNKEHFLAVVRGEKPLHSRPSRNGGRLQNSSPKLQLHDLADIFESAFEVQS
jgi:hypothetical protein